MSMLIQHNMMAWNAERQFNTVTKAKNKKAEKLSSGYRINRAADDAAGLSISEKMRRQIRGLKVGTENAQMGISWVQIGEGALNEAHDILHRMNELSIKAQNGTNTLTDRAYMEAEFEQLQGELDRISTTTTFNELNIFEEHEPVYDQISGNIDWDYEEYHEVLAGKNDLTITYRTEASSEAQVMTISVAAGRYTTHELIDAIDDAFGVDSPIHMEFTEKGFCRLNLEGGEVMDSVKGGLTYLLWDNYDGGGYGTLIGTTEFEKDTDTIRIVRGQNDSMYLEMEFFDPNISGKKGTINLLTASDPDEIRLNKKQIMERINNSINANSDFNGSGLVASDHGTSIQLASPDGIVTGFKGNMFKIENKDPIYTSAFYDNIQHGYVWQDPASVVGGAVLTTDSRDEEHNRFYINSSNNTLVLNPNPATNSVKTPITITIPQKAANANDPTKEGYTAQEMVDELNKIFENTTGLKGEVKAYLVRSSAKVRDPYPDGKNPGGSTETKDDVGDDNLIFEGIEIRTVKEGPDAIVNIDKDKSTAYDTLFTVKNYNKYGKAAKAQDATVANETKLDVNAYAVGTKVHTGNITINRNNNKFEITLRSTQDANHHFNVYDSSKVPTDYSQKYTVTLDNGTRSLADTIKHINTKLGTIKIGEDAAGKNIYLSSRVEAVNDGGKIKIQDKEDLVLDDANDKSLNWYTEIELSSAGGNSGYRDLFQQSYTYTVPTTKSAKGTLTLTGPAKDTTLTITVNGNPYTYYLNGNETAEQIKNKINQDTPITFSSVDGVGETKPENFTVQGSGTRTIPYYEGGNAVGISKERQGKAGYEINTPASLEIGPALTSSMKVEAGVNDAVTLTLNGVTKTVYLASEPGGKTYNQAGLEDALQDAIDDAFGTGMGGAIVSRKGNQLVLTSRLPSDQDGSKTSITAYAQGAAGVNNSFFDSLHDTETAASCTSVKALQSSITLTDGDNDKFRFSFTDEKGVSQNVELDLVDSSEVDGTSTPPNSKTFTRAELVKRINDKLKEIGNPYTDKVTAKADNTTNNCLMLTTAGEGDKTRISYTTGPAGSTDKIATALFGNLDTNQQTTAQISLNRNAKTSVSFTGEKTFQVRIDNTWREVKIRNGWNSTTELQNKLNNGPNGNDGLKSMGVTATVDSNGKITLRKDTPGSGSLHMDYANGGTVKEDMFGTEKKATIPGVTVTNSGANLVITGGANDIITVSSNSSGGMLEGIEKTGYYTHDTSQGFHNPKFSTVTSVDLSKYKDSGIELTRWNNELEFEFSEDNGKTKKNVSFRLTESGVGNKTSIDDIVKELQTKIDAALGKDKVEVLFNNNRLSFKSAKPGAQFQFSGMDSKASNDSTDLDKFKMGGGFYHHVMCWYETKKEQLADPTDINGDQSGNRLKQEDVNIFAQGRHDLIFDPASLHPNMSDTLIIDLNYIADWNHSGTLGDHKAGEQEETLKTITLTLHPKTKTENWLTSSSDEVLRTLREQINVAIEDWNNSAEGKSSGIQLNKNLIDVDIGRHQTDIVGNKDKVSISFTLTQNPDIATPVEGYFYIDGIRGNAAYETFYHTEGDLIPAFIEGTKDISDGVVLGKDDNQLVFLVDDEMKIVDLSKLEKGKKYSADEIVEAIANEFTAQNLPLAVSISQKGNLRFSFDRMGLHRIEQVTGSARNKLFFEEHAAKRLPNERDIRVSSFEGDRLSVYSPRFSTTMLGINSICISTVKNAEKATNRLKEAIRKVSDMRSTFGAIQNRFEHTVNNNLNKHENLQAAESRIRDADISDEMVEFSNLSIIQQAGQAVLAQANQSRNAMLALLG